MKNGVAETLIRYMWETNATSHRKSPLIGQTLSDPGSLMVATRRDRHAKRALIAAVQRELSEETGFSEDGTSPSAICNSSRPAG